MFKSSECYQPEELAFESKVIGETDDFFCLFVFRIIFIRALELFEMRAVICGVLIWRTRTTFLC